MDNKNKKQQTTTFYDLYLVRTKGIKSIIYRFLTNSVWDKLAFKTSKNIIVSVDYDGIQYMSEEEFDEKFETLEVKRCPTYFIWEPVAYQRLLKIKNIRKCRIQILKIFINKFVNFLGKKMNIKRLNDFKFKPHKIRVSESGFIIRMFGMGHVVTEYDKDVKWFENNTIYSFLNIDENSVSVELKDDFFNL